jgi:hypothetical protein
MTSKNTRQPSSAAATKARKRAQEAAQAMQDYDAEKLALRANTARLRALRLAKEAGNAPDPETRQPATKTTKPTETI